MSAMEEPKYDLASAQFFADPHAVFRRMRVEDPIYWHPVMRAWLLVRYDDVQRMLRDPRFSAMRSDMYARDMPPELAAAWQVVNRSISRMLLFSDAPFHTRLRGLVNRAFTSRAAEVLQPFIQRVVDDQIDEIRGGGTMDVIAQVARPLPVAVISKLLGIATTDFPRFKECADDLFALVGSTVTTAEHVERGHRGIVGLTAYLASALDERRDQPGEDLLSVLANVNEQDQALARDDIVAMAALLLIAGYETTTHLIGNGLLALLEHPDQLAKLRANPALAAEAVEELVRYNGTTFRLIRRARAPIELDGHRIGEGDMVIGLLHAANRDPARFVDPDKLEITRANNHHVGFGHGPHFCIGAPIARLETQIAINTMLQRLPGIALATTQLEWSTRFATRGVRALPVTFRV